MAMGKSAHTSIADVKAHIGALEVSPSHHSSTSPIAHGGARAVGHGVGGHQTTGKFSSHGKTTRPKPRGTRTGFGKKSHSSNKTSGR